MTESDDGIELRNRFSESIDGPHSTFPATQKMACFSKLGPVICHHPIFHGTPGSTVTTVSTLTVAFLVADAQEPMQMRI